MPVTTTKKKPARKAVILGPSLEPTSLDKLTLTLTPSTTLEQSQTLTLPIIVPQADARAQANRMASNTLRALV
jgi:hypothetical protein